MPYRRSRLRHNTDVDSPVLTDSMIRRLLHAHALGLLSIVTEVAACSEPARRPSVDFPDLSSFAPAGPTMYSLGNKDDSGLGFSTPSGQRCFLYTDSSSDPAHIDCSGPIPGRVHDWALHIRRGTTASVGELVIKSGPGMFRPPPPPTLPIGHVLKAAQDDALCGILDNGAAACRIGEHGFVAATDKLALF